MKTSVLTIRVDEDMNKRLNNIAKATARTKSFIAAEAIRTFLDLNEWQIQAVKEAVEKADKPDAKFVDHETVAMWLQSWGTDKELEPPKCK